MDTSTLTNQIPDWTEVDFENITNITVVYCRLSQEDSRGQARAILSKIRRNT